MPECRLQGGAQPHGLRPRSGPQLGAQGPVEPLELAQPATHVPSPWPSAGRAATWASSSAGSSWRMTSHRPARRNRSARRMRSRSRASSRPRLVEVVRQQGRRRSASATAAAASASPRSSAARASASNRTASTSTSSSGRSRTMSPRSTTPEVCSPRERRAKCAALCRRGPASATPIPGHSASMTCSRCRRRSGARASSLTRAAALRRPQASSGTATPPTDTRKPPSNVIATSMSHSERLACPSLYGARGCPRPEARN